jgi:hypothetical protein
MGLQLGTKPRGTLRHVPGHHLKCAGVLARGSRANRNLAIPRVLEDVPNQTMFLVLQAYDLSLELNF